MLFDTIYDRLVLNPSMYQLSVLSNSVAVTQQPPLQVQDGEINDIQYVGGLMYSSGGSIYDPSSGALQTFPPAELERVRHRYCWLGRDRRLVVAGICPHRRYGLSICLGPDYRGLQSDDSQANLDRVLPFNQKSNHSMVNKRISVF